MSIYTRQMTDGRRVEALKAKSAVIPGYAGFWFFAFRTEDPQRDTEREYVNPPKIWCLCEETTGRSIAWDATLERVIAQAKERLDEMGGPEWLKEKLASVKCQRAQEALF